MPSVDQILFLPSGETREFYGSRGDHYGLEDGSQLDLWSRPVWCHRCHDFTDGEYIGSLEEIDQHLEELRDPSSQLSQALRFRQVIIEGIERRRRWQLSRASSPKCLECGSAEIVVLPRGERVENPTGPGWVEVTVKGFR